MVKITGRPMREKREFWDPSKEGVPKNSRSIPRLYGGNIREKFPKFPTSSRSKMRICSKTERFQHLIKSLPSRSRFLSGNFWKFPLGKIWAGNAPKIRSKFFSVRGSNDKSSY